MHLAQSMSQVALVAYNSSICGPVPLRALDPLVVLLKKATSGSRLGQLEAGFHSSFSLKIPVVDKLVFKPTILKMVRDLLCCMPWLMLLNGHPDKVWDLNMCNPWDGLGWQETGCCTQGFHHGHRRRTKEPYL